MLAKQKSPLFDERAADHKVIDTLLSEIRRIKMPIVKTVDGKFYRVDESQEVSAEDAQSELTHLQNKVAELEGVLASPADPTPPAAADPSADAPDQSAAPPAPDPANPPAPADPNPPADSTPPGTPAPQLT